MMRKSRNVCRGLVLRAAVVAGCASVYAARASAQTTIPGSSIALQSAGSNVINQNGYVGTYLTLAAPGTVSFSVNAQSAAGAAATPHMAISVDDTTVGFSVATSASDYSTSVYLPAGTHFVRTQLDNYAGRSLTVNSLTVTGATVANSGTSANALAASNTYIDNFRKGGATISLVGPGNIKLLPGTPVNAKMVRNAFNFGGTVSGVSNNDSKDMLQLNPAAGTEAYKFQQFINSNFNTIVPSNAGKWAYNEPSQNSVNMTLVDKQLAYAQAHNMRARMHNVIWGSGTLSGNQQPNWVNSLISSAAGGNVTARTNLSTAISNRMKYYVGTTGNRATKYIELDVLNESLHNPSYWNIYGAAGVANIYNQAAAAAAAAGNPNLRLDLNEWNVVQYSTDPATGISDPYANWYRKNNEDVIAAGGAVSGIGIQYYANVTQTGSNAHSAATIQKALQNLSIENLPISMAEFGLATSTSKSDSQALGPQVLDDTMRMFFGNPLATTFMIWGWWDTSGSAYPSAALLDNSNGNNTLTPMGTKWQQLMAAWSTNATPAVDANGNITFNGFYGDYNIGGAGGFSNLTLAKGTSNYNLSLAAPTDWHFWNTSVDGNFSVAGNWTNGTPSGNGHTAYFGNSAAARAVAINAPVTLGMINFDSTGTYTLSGPGTISLVGYAGASAINVVAGNHTIDAPIESGGSVQISVIPAASTLSIVGDLSAAATSISKTGAGVLQIGQLETTTLTINAGTLRLSQKPTANAPATRSTIRALSIASDGGAKLDTTNNQLLIVLDGGPSPVDDVRAALQSGRIYTSAGQSVGYADEGTTVLLQYAFGGDASLDGKVDIVDLGALASHWQQSGQYWAAGDFNYDGQVNIVDLGILAAHWQNGVTAPLAPGEADLSTALAALGLPDVPSAVPEPAIMTILASVAALSFSRRRQFIV